MTKNVSDLLEVALLLKESGLTEEIFKNPKEEYTEKLIAAIPKVTRKKDR